MTSADKLEWGWKNPMLIAEALWGARCYEETDYNQTRPRTKLVSRVTLAVLFDRQDLIGTDEAKLRLRRLLNGSPGKPGALDALRDAWNHSGDFIIGHDGEAMHYLFDLKGVQFHAREYGGYVYVTAQEIKETKP